MTVGALGICTKQICVVVNDLARAMKHYVDILHVGPWAVYTYEPPHLHSMKLYGEEASYSMRLAIAWSGGFMWEIIQPLTGKSIYREFLDEHGEGVHHVCISSTEPTDRVREHLLAHGISPIMEGTFKGASFAYYDAMDTLHTVVETVDRPNGTFRTNPDYWYPHPPIGPYGDFPRTSSGFDLKTKHRTE